MRTVYSATDCADVPAELSEAIRELVDPAGPAGDWFERETSLISGKREVYTARVFSYAEPGTGRLRWAVHRWEWAGERPRLWRRSDRLTIEDTGDRERAVARYEEIVREDAALGRAAHGEDFTFDRTDVPGVPGYRLVPCEVCGRPVGEGRIEADISRKGAPTLYRVYCSERHFRQDLARPLPTPPAPRRRPAPRPPRIDGAAPNEGLTCSVLLLGVCVLLLLLPVAKALGLVWW
ncbi:hypothetical protein GCM10009760_21830 [Kitasatospora kazusensis]|uniref:DUF4178 domain-containing protein n=1 Tax=Kitasatospora kazusensis TaxID=407974 RepID=A0ABP5KZ26_9ACTN